MKRIFLCIILLAMAMIHNASYAQDKILSILKSELSQQQKELRQKELPPYYMNYKVTDEYVSTISTSFGSLLHSKSVQLRYVYPQVRVGSMEFDNFKMNDMAQSRRVTPLPIGNNIDVAMSQALWSSMFLSYKSAVDAYKNAKVNSYVTTATIDKSPCFTKSPVNKFYEKLPGEDKLYIDMDKWAEAIKRVSAVFDDYPQIIDGSATLSHKLLRTYFVDTDGTEVVQNQPYAMLIVSCSTKAGDGMVLPLEKSYFAYDINNLSDLEQIIKETRLMADKLMELRDAPVVDPYTGPVLMSGAAAGVFFHEIFGHRLEGQRMKRDSDGHTFKSMVDKNVLPKSFMVCDDPVLTDYNGMDLNGSYKYDDQGVKSEKVNIVVNGVLKNFLMTKTPIDGFPRSNGHARSEGAADPVSRQSNLIIESNENLSEKDMRDLLIKEIKKQGKEYGFYFKKVTGGFTQTSAMQVNSFSVNPTEVYQVFVDGREDRLVRGVDLIGTPLSMFSNIAHGGNKNEIFTGMCGAESGWIPVTAIAPSILCTKVEMQRKAKSSELPPILNAPKK